MTKKRFKRGWLFPIVILVFALAVSFQFATVAYADSLLPEADLGSESLSDSGDTIYISRVIIDDQPCTAYAVADASTVGESPSFAAMTPITKESPLSAENLDKNIVIYGNVGQVDLYCDELSLADSKTVTVKSSILVNFFDGSFSADCGFECYRLGLIDATVSFGDDVEISNIICLNTGSELTVGGDLTAGSFISLVGCCQLDVDGDLDCNFFTAYNTCTVNIGGDASTDDYFAVGGNCEAVVGGDLTLAGMLDVNGGFVTYGQAIGHDSSTGESLTVDGNVSASTIGISDNGTTVLFKSNVNAASIWIDGNDADGRSTTVTMGTTAANTVNVNSVALVTRAKLDVVGSFSCISLSVYNNAEADLHGDCTLTGRFILLKTSSAHIGGDMNCYSLQTSGNVDLTIDGDVTSTGSILATEYTELHFDSEKLTYVVDFVETEPSVSIGGSVNAGGELLAHYDADFKVSGNVTANSLLCGNNNDSSSITIGGKAAVTGSLQVNSDSSVALNGTEASSCGDQLNVVGDFICKGSFTGGNSPFFNNGSNVSISGDLSYGKNSYGACVINNNAKAVIGGSVKSLSSYGLDFCAHGVLVVGGGLDLGHGRLIVVQTDSTLPQVSVAGTTTAQAVYISPSVVALTGGVKAASEYRVAQSATIISGAPISGGVTPRTFDSSYKEYSYTPINLGLKNAALTMVDGDDAFTFNSDSNGSIGLLTLGDETATLNFTTEAGIDYKVIVIPNEKPVVEFFPSISSQPVSVAVPAGNTAVFSVSASGSSPLSYQWMYADKAISGATQSKLIITDVSPADSGSYACKVTNNVGSVTSDTAYLTVTAPGDVVATKVNTSMLEDALAYYIPGETRTGFADVSVNDWFYDAVSFVTEKGLMNGTAANQFSPDAATTRAMVVTVLWRLEGSPVTAGSAFTDLSDDWYRSAVNWASDMGIVNGYGDGTFGPSDVITRQQLAAILYRYGEYKGRDVSASTAIDDFADAAAVDEYALASMQWCVAEGIINGSNDSLDPAAPATRAQLAAILQRYIGK